MNGPASFFHNHGQKIYRWMVLAFIFAIPVSQVLSVRLMIGALLVSFFLPGQKQSFQGFLYACWDIVLFILVLAAGLLYTSDMKTGLASLETSFSLLAVPFVFRHYHRLGFSMLKDMYRAFTLGLMTACVFIIAYAAYSYFQTGDTSFFFFYKLTDVIKSHPSYMAYYLIFAITMGLYLYYYESEPKQFIKLLVPSLVFFVVLILTAGRTTYISMLLVISFFILKFLLEERSQNKTVVFATAILMLVSLFAVNTLESEQKAADRETSDYWERSALWRSAVQANPNPLFGVGTGDYKTELNEYFKTNHLDEFASSSFNAHNQFLQTYFSNGLVGLLALMLMFGRPLYLSVQSSFPLGVLIFFPLVIYGVTEVFLGRYQGVVLFIFLHQMVVLHGIGLRAAPVLKSA